MEINLGVAEDPRSEEAKAMDYQHDEVAAGAPFVWVEKTQEDWNHFTPREQDGSSSCCGQGSAKAMETLLGTVESAHPIYRRRSNYPDSGMYLQNVGDICKNQGTTKEAFDVSENLNEDKINAPVMVVTPDKIGNYIFVDFTNIDAIAGVISQHKNCILIVHGNWSGEWLSGQPVFKPNLPVDFGHCITAVDAFLYSGIKNLLIEDSSAHPSSFDGKGQRLITEEYLKARFIGAMYFIPFVPIPKTKPVHLFTVPLTYGMMGNSDVKILQDILKQEGLFPASIASTGNFLGITATCIKKWQIKHGIMDFANETNPKNIRFGEKSIVLANSLYSK